MWQVGVASCDRLENVKLKNAHFQKSFETDKDSRSAPGLLESSSANTIWKT
jgi:hypothetical protein